VITIWIQIKQVEAANKQAKLTLEGIKEASKQQFYLALEPRIGEVISNEAVEKFLQRFPHGSLTDEPNLTRYALEALNEQEFLARLSGAIERFKIPLDQRFRRQALFKALDMLCSTSSAEQALQFKNAIQSQIHDESARMLIITASAERDGTTLRIFGRLGIDFNVLNDSQPVADKLASLYLKT
jgi:hypothetical protein